MPEQDRRPNWIRAMANRVPAELPPEPNPFDHAQQQWAELRSYAAQCADALRVADETGRALQLENDALRRELDHIRVYMGDEIDQLRRENRLVTAYATNLRSRLTVIRESIVAAETEALQFAANEVRKPIAAVPDEDAQVAEIHDAIVRANSPERRGVTGMPINQFTAQ